MSEARPPGAWSRAHPAALFIVAGVSSAALVFAVEPMMARLALPVLGGSAAVWNASLAFFQGALLGGYLYAHLLQSIASLRAQLAIHLAVLLGAAVVLPLGLSRFLGDPSSSAPDFWLLGTLAVSVGPPFMALSATAPLTQAWFARTAPPQRAGEVWRLYAASNAGSLAALIAYPVLIEPLTRLAAQRVGWSLGYLLFAAVIGLLATRLWNARAQPAAEVIGVPDEAPTTKVTWLDRARWTALAAIPSSLLLGVTSYVSTDIGSAPFLWVAPLCLYLLSFIVAFQARPAIRPHIALLAQAISLAAAAALLHVQVSLLLLGGVLHFAAFFFIALVCHQALVARRPETGRLTEFYLYLSLGGVIGGSFNAFLAPVIFSNVFEYPAVLAVSALARPWGRGKPSLWIWGALALCAAAALFSGARMEIASLMVLLGAVAALFTQARAWAFALAIGLLLIASERVSDRVDVTGTWRDFFGVLRQSAIFEPRLGGEVRMLAHGTTLHGAQAPSPAFRCQPLVYYARPTPIGQVITTLQASRPVMDFGIVGLGTGAVASYRRSADAMTFYEIDPLVVRIASDPRHFTYLSACAARPPAIVLGDARLTLARTPDGALDLLLIDAFASDSVPAHLLTVEAMRMYLAKLKPDGVLILHLSNRNLDLLRPAQAAALDAGGVVLMQRHQADRKAADYADVPEDAVIAARSRATLAPFIGDPRWRPAEPQGVTAWTDDYTNLFGALVRRTQDRLNGRGS